MRGWHVPESPVWSSQAGFKWFCDHAAEDANKLPHKIPKPRGSPLSPGEHVWTHASECEECTKQLLAMLYRLARTGLAYLQQNIGRDEITINFKAALYSGYSEDGRGTATLPRRSTMDATFLVEEWGGPRWYMTNDDDRTEIIILRDPIIWKGARPDTSFTDQYCKACRSIRSMLEDRREDLYNADRTLYLLHQTLSEHRDACSHIKKAKATFAAALLERF